MTPPSGPKSSAETGRFDEVRSELAAYVKSTEPTSAGNRGRRVLLSMCDSIGDIAKPADTVNATFNYSPGATGQLNLTAVLTLTPAMPDTP